MRHERVRIAAGDALTFPDSLGAVGVVMPVITRIQAYRIVGWPQAQESRGVSWR